MIKSEEQFIDFISNNFNKIKNIPDSWIGIGDDAASIDLSNKNVIFCSDAMVEDVHFRSSHGYESVGWKSIVSNQSDLAGMGAFASAFTISLGINSDFSEKDISLLYKGMNDACESYGGYLVGGDVVNSEKIFISISAIGELYKKNSLLLRNKANVGDVIAVTGEIGEAGAGFFALEKELSNYKKQKESFLKPKPRIHESKNAIKNGIICGMDLSDGLQKDLSRISNSSKVSIEIDLDSIPFDKELNKLYKKDLFEKLISSGEDYQLILIGDMESIKKMSIKNEITIIGKVVNNNTSELIFLSSKKNIKIKSKGFDHFGK